MTTNLDAVVPLIASMREIGAAREAWISDIWGVLHNGIEAFPSAAEACVRYREQGGVIVLVTNAPRPESDVSAMLARLGVPRGAYDAIVTSGDVTRDLIRPWQRQGVHHLGPDRQSMIFEGLDVALVPLAQADVVVCTGLVDDDRETPDDYRAILSEMRRADPVMICANPDIVVERGDRIVYCAGALAEAYEALGGRVQYAGKPHAPIYRRAFELIAEAKGRPVAPEHILAIGDGLRTDIEGARRMDLASLFIGSALHVPHGRALDEALLASLFDDHPMPPLAAQRALVW